MSFLVDVYCKVSAQVFQPASPIRSIVVACLRRRILRFGSLFFHVLGDNSCAYIFLVTSSGEYPFCYEGQEGKLGALHVFVVA